MSDLFKTQLQGTGRASTLGLTLAEVVEDVVELGIDAHRVILSGSQAAVMEQSDALDVADEILAELGEPVSMESLRMMLALAWAKGTRAGLLEGAEIYERKAIA